MRHTQPYKIARRTWNRKTETMTDGELLREHERAENALCWSITPTAQARFDACEAEIDHRDCWR